MTSLAFILEYCHWLLQWRRCRGRKTIGWTVFNACSDNLAIFVVQYYLFLSQLSYGRKIKTGKNKKERNDQRIVDHDWGNSPNSVTVAASN
jgi:hypothetical protein